MDIIILKSLIFQKIIILMRQCFCYLLYIYFLIIERLFQSSAVDCIQCRILNFAFQPQLDQAIVYRTLQKKMIFFSFSIIKLQNFDFYLEKKCL